tara:strand:+ start:4468 stop:5709 length:1242 start_codon:yes stop_codon:yes gene_type:complete
MSFEKIINPTTGRLVSIHSKTGATVLSNYVKYDRTGGGKKKRNSKGKAAPHKKNTKTKVGKYSPDRRSRAYQRLQEAYLSAPSASVLAARAVGEAASSVGAAAYSAASSAASSAAGAAAAVAARCKQACTPDVIRSGECPGCGNMTQWSGPPKQYDRPGTIPPKCLGCMSRSVTQPRNVTVDASECHEDPTMGDPILRREYIRRRDNERRRREDEKQRQRRETEQLQRREAKRRHMEETRRKKERQTNIESFLRKMFPTNRTLRGILYDDIINPAQSRWGFGVSYRIDNFMSQRDDSLSAEILQDKSRIRYDIRDAYDSIISSSGRISQKDRARLISIIDPYYFLLRDDGEDGGSAAEAPLPPQMTPQMMREYIGENRHRLGVTRPCLCKGRVNKSDCAACNNIWRQFYGSRK